MKCHSNKIILASIAWAVIIGCGVFAIAKYDATPGAGATIGANAAIAEAIDVAKDKMTLLMFLHPKCACSAASVQELSKLMMQCGSRLHVQVLMFQSSDQPADWNHTATWAGANSIPGVAVHSDIDGIFARKCGAQTSGQVLLYDKGGHLLFKGGITGSRGHVGDNDGLDILTKLVLGQIHPGTPLRAPVFGCAIYSSSNDKSALPSNRMSQ